MADRFDVVTLDAAGLVEQVVFDFNDMDEFSIVADSLTVSAPPKQQNMVESSRRYDGSRQVGETQGNAQFSALILVAGSSVDDVLQQVAAALAVLERDPRDLHLRWVPDGASEQAFSEIRSTAQWGIAPKWAQLTGAHSITVQVGWQVAPLARGTPVTMTQWRGSLPAVIQLDRTIPGNAPALADVTVTTDATADEPIWALLGWTPRPAAGLAPAPFGVMAPEAAGDLAGWRLDGGLIRDQLASSSKTYTASWAVDPALLAPDDFAGTVDVEVWAYMVLFPQLVSPVVTVSARPEDGLAFGAARWTQEWGRLGRPVPVPSFATFRLSRLGTVTFTVDPHRPRPWKLWIDGRLGAGSSGTWGFQHLLLVPARARVCSRTGVQDDDRYARFIASKAPTRKTIHADATAHVGRPNVHGHPDHGLGGGMLELPTGEVDLAVYLASQVPDNPNPAVRGAHVSYWLSVDVTVIPRWHLLAA